MSPTTETVKSADTGTVVETIDADDRARNVKATTDGVMFVWTGRNDVGLFKSILLEEYGWVVTSVDSQYEDPFIYLEPLA